MSGCVDVWLEWDGGILMDGNEQKVGFAEKKLRLTQKMVGGFIFGARHKSGQSYQFLNKKA